MASRILGVVSVRTDWEALMRKAIQMAEQTRDPRLGHLKKAQMGGTSQKVLRQYGIISEADLLREFTPSGK